MPDFGIFIHIFDNSRQYPGVETDIRIDDQMVWDILFQRLAQGNVVPGTITPVIACKNIPDVKISKFGVF